MKDQTSQELHRECTKYEPLKNSTLRKNQWKSELLKSFHENVLSVDLWKFHFQEISMKDQISQELHRNVLSIDLWKIPHLENIEERPNFSRVSSNLY